jgi:bifunctional non-homologous end joining protein LigD
MVTFHGERVRGRYVLFRTDGKNWMIHRMDPPEDPDREPMPERSSRCSPAPASCPPRRRRWAYEIKWDGVRAIGYARAAGCGWSRNGNDITPRYPELRELGGRSARARRCSTARSSRSTDGRPSFQRLQGACT